MTEVKFIKVGASLVRYRVEGSGEPLVLIHGLGGSSGWWVRNAGVLGRHFRVYTVDLPGFGAMRRSAEAFSIPGAVAWLQTFVHALELEKVSLIGHSMGGLIAAIFAAECPARLQRLILAAPAIGLPNGRIASYVLPLARETLRVERSFWRTLIWDSLRAGFPTTLRASRELLGYKLENELSQISTPCLLVWGELDPMVPAMLGRELQRRIPGSQLRIVKGAGHVLMYDHAEQFNTLALEFLTGRFDLQLEAVEAPD